MTSLPPAPREANGRPARRGPWAGRSPLLLGTALGSILTLGYGRGAYAQQVCVGGPPNFVCSGASLDSQTLLLPPGVNLHATAADGFSVLTVEPYGLDFGVTEAVLSFTDSPAGSTITAGTTGMRLRSFDPAGNLTVSANGTVTGATLHGIDAQMLLSVDPPTNPHQLIVTTGAASLVTGGFTGIYALNAMFGGVTVTANGMVAGTSLAGIFGQITRDDNTGALSVTTAEGSSVTGGYFGILAVHAGRGELAVTVDGEVAGTDRDGIAASSTNYANAAAQTITVGAEGSVTGGESGISARHSGTGALDIMVDGEVEGGNYGIGASTLNAASAAAQTITVGAEGSVTGVWYGIRARHYGTGALDIMVDGAVEGTAGFGIHASSTNAANAAAQTITVGAEGSVTGGVDGIRARHFGTGALDIMVDGAVEGTNAIGIDASSTNASNAAALTITVGAEGAVTGGVYGIRARHYGIGALDITVEGAVEGTAAFGVSAELAFDMNAQALTITLGAEGSASGGVHGITAVNRGSGEMTISVDGSVAAAMGIGIYAHNANPSSVAGQTLTIGATGVVNSDFMGILARQDAAGAQTITVEGAVFGMGSLGLYARSLHPLGAAQTLTVAASGTINGRLTGIVARQQGTGALDITVEGQVAGAGDLGVNAMIQNIDSTAALDITVALGGRVTGGTTGIATQHQGRGALSVTVDGQVSGGSDFGLFASSSNGLNTAALTVSVGAGGVITGEQVGVVALQNGSGALEVAVAGSVGASVLGLYASQQNPASGGAVSVTTEAGSSVAGLDGGIIAIHDGAGAIGITVGGIVEGTGGNGIAAQIRNAGSTGDIAITAAEGSQVNGGNIAIGARHEGLGTLAVTVDGTVIGGALSALFAEADNAAEQMITIGATGVVTAGASDVAILASGTGVGIDNAGTITGLVLLSANDDVMTNRGLWRTAGLTSDFGAGNDLFENRGTLLAANDALAAQTTRLSNLETFANRGGTIRLADGLAGDVLEISGNFVADGGVIEIDVMLDGDASDTDRLTIGGNATRDGAATGILVNPLGGSGTQTVDGILLIEVQGTSDDDVFTLANAVPLEIGAFVYDLSFGSCAGAADNNWYLCSTEAVGNIGGLYEAGPSVLMAAFASLPTLEQRLRQRQWIAGGDQGLASRGLPADPAMGGGRIDGVWMRLHGETADINPQTSSALATHSRRHWGLQMGADLPAREGDRGDWVLGLTGQWGSLSAEVRNGFGTGWINASGWGLGATATWYGHGGTYLDLQGQVQRISARFETAAQGLLAEGRGATAYALSAELGHRFALDGATTLVPQAQLSWASLDADGFTDAQGNAVVMGRTSATTGRIGLSWERRLQGTAAGGSGGGEHMVYGIVNLRHDFTQPGPISVAGTPLQLNGYPTWGEIGFGGAMAVAPNAIFYGQASYRVALGAPAGNRAFVASAGLRVRW